MNGKPKVVSVTEHHAKRNARPGTPDSPFRLVAVYDPQQKLAPASQDQATPPVKTDSRWLDKVKSLITKRV